MKRIQSEREGVGWAVFWHADKSFSTLSYYLSMASHFSCSHTLSFSSFCDTQGWLAIKQKFWNINAFAYSWDNMHTCIIICTLGGCNIALLLLACTASYKTYNHVAAQHNTAAVASQSLGRSAGQRLVHSVCLWGWEKQLQCTLIIRLKIQGPVLIFIYIFLLLSFVTIHEPLYKFCTAYDVQILHAVYWKVKLHDGWILPG